jgi:hypothetical protein
VKVYIEKVYKADVGFYVSGVDDGVNAVRVYNLKPDTIGYFKDIQVCSTPTCDGKEITPRNQFIL